MGAASAETGEEKGVGSNTGLDIGLPATECPSQLDIENYVVRGQIGCPKAFPKHINNKKFPESIIKFRNVIREQHNMSEIGLSEVNLNKHCTDST